MLASTHGGHPNATYRVLYVDYGEEEEEVPVHRVRRASQDVELALERATAGPGIDEYGRDLRAEQAPAEPEPHAPWTLDATGPGPRSPPHRAACRRTPSSVAASRAGDAGAAAGVLHPRLRAPGERSREQDNSTGEIATQEAIARARSGLAERRLLRHQPQPAPATAAGEAPGAGGMPAWKHRLLAAREARRKEQEGREEQAQRERERRQADARRIAKEANRRGKISFALPGAIRPG